MATAFEDLPIKQFISKLKSLGEYTISAQADGVLFYFGIDTDNNFYTSQYSPNKRTKFAYKVNDYQLSVENNQFRAAHIALSNNKEIIEKILESGQAIECQLVANAETQFGGTHSKIILIRPIVGEATLAKSNVITEISEKFDKLIQVKAKQVVSYDGTDLQDQTVISHWKVTKSKTKNANLLTSSKLHSLLDKLETYLALPNKKAESLGLQLSNLDVAAANLTKIKMDLRSQIETERDKLNSDILKKFKFPIKSEIIAKLEMEFGTQAGLLHKGSEGIWIASSSFEDSARFDTAPKRELKGFQRSQDKNASDEERGGVEGIVEQRIATLLGTPELANFQSAKKIFKSFRGENPRATAKAFAEQLGSLNFYGIKTKIAAIYAYSINEVEKKLNDFKENVSDFKHVTGEKEQLNFSPADIKNNLAFFAQTIENFKDRAYEVQRSKSFTDIILTLYEPVIFSLHGKHIVEELLVEAINHPPITQVAHMSADDICHAYTATILASQLLLRTQNKKASSILKDSSHASLKSFTPAMSPLNFWGLMAFSPFAASMKGKLPLLVFDKLKKRSGRVIYPRVNNMHKQLSTGSFMQDWQFQEDSAKVISMRIETRGQSINMVIAGIRNWDDIALSDRNIVVTKVFYYLQQYVPTSSLLPLVRHLATEILTHAAKENNLNKDHISELPENLFQNLSNLLEYEMGGNTISTALGAGAVSANFADLGTQIDASSANQNNKQQFRGQQNKPVIKFMNGKPIIRRVRDFVRKPDFERETVEVREDDAGDTSAIDTSSMTTSSAIASYPQRLFDTKKKKKKTIKRIIPYHKPVKSGLDDMFKDLSEELKAATLIWNDEDYSGNIKTDEGMKYIKQQYKLIPSLIKEKSELNEWPIIKLIGEKHQLENFLKNEYGASAEFIAEHIKSVNGD